MKDVVVVATLVIAFALFVTVHVTTTFGLAKKEPRWRALVGFVVPPAAIYWAWREHMRVRAGVGGGALALYVAARVLASL